MRHRTAKILAVSCGVLIILLMGANLLPFQGQAKRGVGFAAVPAEKGGQDIFGPYQVVPDWPKPFAQLSGHEKSTWGAMAGVFPESPNRVLIAQQGELPMIERPKQISVGPSLVFPLRDLPSRRASDTPFLNIHGTDQMTKAGVDGRWEHCLLALDAKGNIVEAWTQWDKLFTQPHAIYLDPEKNVRVVDDWVYEIFKFVADGNVNSCVVKFDKGGKYLMAWGHEGNPPNGTPGYFNVVHGSAVDPVARRVYVRDRSNRRIQVFDENGKFIDQWSLGPVSQPQFLFMSADRHLWVSDFFSPKILKYDLERQFLYS